MNDIKIIYDAIHKKYKDLVNSLTRKEDKSNKISTITDSDEQYPSAKAVYDAIQTGGGSCPLNILVTGENLEELQNYGPTIRSGLAEYFGVTEGQLQDLMDGKYSGLVGPNNIVFWLIE